MSRVLGGESPEVGEAMRVLYSTYVEGELDVTDPVTAELVKTAENAYRDVNIAFANELAVISEVVGASVWEVRELVNKSPGRNVLRPGAGVGGHCIPKDPWLLVHPLGSAAETTLVARSRSVNDGMPAHVASLIDKVLVEAEITHRPPVICVLGYAYLEESDDTRNSPSAPLVEILRERGHQVRIHDPYVPAYRGALLTAARGADALIVMVAHEAYRQLDLAALADSMRTRILVDARGVIEIPAAAAAGFTAVRLGDGRKGHGLSR